MALNVTQVNQGFLALLGRPATGAEATKFAAISDVVTLGNAIAADAALSTEIVTPFPELIQPDLNAASNELFVESLYVSLIGRASDADGKTFWLGALTAGANRADILSQFISALEAQAVEGTTDGQAFLDKQAENVSVIHTWLEELYANTLGRSADQEGLDFWTNAVLAGTTPAAVAANFAVALAAQGDTTTDGQIFANKTTAANSFTASFNDFNSFVSDAEKKALYNELRDMIKEIDQNTKPEDYAESIATKVNTYEKSKLANISYTSSDEDVLGVDEEGNVNTTNAVHFKGTYNLADEAKGTIQSTDQITGNDLYENNILEVGVTGITTEAKNLELGNVLGTIQNDSIQKLVVNNNKATVSGEINGAQWKTVEINGGGGSESGDTSSLTIGADADLALLKVASTANTAAQENSFKNNVTVNGTLATIRAGAGRDMVTVSGADATVNNIDLGGGKDTLIVSGGAILGNATLGAGDDSLTVSGSTIVKDSTISLGAGDDEATLTLASLAANTKRTNITVDLGAGDDKLTIGAAIAKIAATPADSKAQDNISLIGGAGDDKLILATGASGTFVSYTAVSEISSFETIELNATAATSGATIAAGAADGLKTKLAGQGLLDIDADKYTGKIDLSGITKVDDFTTATQGTTTKPPNVDVTLGTLALSKIEGTDYNAGNKTTGNDTITVSGTLKGNLTIDAKSTTGGKDTIKISGLKQDKVDNVDASHTVTIDNLGNNSAVELKAKNGIVETINAANASGNITIKGFTITDDKNTSDVVHFSDAAIFTTASGKSGDVTIGANTYKAKISAGGVVTLETKDVTPTAVTSVSAENLLKALQAATGDAKLADNETVIYQQGNNTYILNAGAKATKVSDDMIVTLVGLKDVTTLNVGNGTIGASGDITLA